MNRNVLYVLIGGLVVLAAGLGYALHQEQQKTSGIDISVGGKGISVETK
jgi:hypothetical protein